MHEYIIGKTGSGKSTLAENELSESGFTFIDPHGQSAEKIADTHQGVIYCEPFDPECPFALNPFARVPEPLRPLVAEQFISALKSVYPDSWGPNLEDILRNACYVALDNNLSPVALPKILTDRAYRTRLVSKVSNREVVSFWREEFPNRKNPEDEIRSTLNKVRILALNPTLRRVLSRNSINLRRVMDKGQRFVLNLNVSVMGEKPSAILGALVINAMYQAAIGRSAIPEARRVPHKLVVDEWQNFATTTFGNILAEARKYKLSLTLLNQAITQVDPHLFEIVVANVGRLVAFRVSGADAKRLALEFGLHNAQDYAFDRSRSFCDLGVHEENTLAELPQFCAFVKDSEESELRYYLLKTDPPAPARGYLPGNRARTRSRYRKRTAL